MPRSVEIVVDGHVLPERRLGGRRYVAVDPAHAGRPFTVRVNNDLQQQQQDTPVAFWVSVDGVKESVWRYTGYGQSYWGVPCDIQGFNVSDTELRRFTFSKPDPNFNNETDDARMAERQIGCIEVTFWSVQAVAPYAVSGISYDSSMQLTCPQLRHCADGEHMLKLASELGDPQEAQGPNQNLEWEILDSGDPIKTVTIYYRSKPQLESMQDLYESRERKKIKRDQTQHPFPAQVIDLT